MTQDQSEEIKRLREQVDRLMSTIEERGTFYKEMLRSCDEGRSSMMDVMIAIIKEEKPDSDPAVKRICKMAREALGV